MPYPYNAIIKEKSRVITGMDADGKYCLDGNEKLEITPFEPETFRAFTLREVAKLTFTGGRWLLDERDITGRWFDGLEKAGGVAGRMDSAAMTEMRTVHSLRQTLEGLSPEARTKIKGVAWFDEGFDKIEGETAESCKRQEDFLNGRDGGGYEIPPKPPAEEYRPVLLADFHVSPQSTGDGQHVMSYGAVIEGRKRQVTGFDEQRNLVLSHGQRYIFELLNYNPSGQPREEPDGDVFGWPLLEAVKLQQWEGSWKWNSEEQLLDQWVKSEVERFGGESQAFEQPEFFKRRVVKSRLDALPPVQEAKVCGVAWFEHDDGTGGWNTPIFLKSFRLLSSNAKPGVASDPQVGFIIRGKRFRHTPEFDYVQVGEELFDLRRRRMAKACLQYLVAEKAFDDTSARHIANDIDPQVRKVCDSEPLKYSTPKIDNYFANDRTGKLKRLRKELVRSAGKNGTFYLRVD
jgi:hypothetical protein